MKCEGGIEKSVPMGDVFLYYPHTNFLFSNNTDSLTLKEVPQFAETQYNVMTSF